MYILHTFIKLKIQSYHHQKPPPLPYADLRASWPTAWSAITRLSLSGRSGLASVTGLFGCTRARSARSWRAAARRREARRSRSCWRGRRARWAPAGSGSAAWACPWPAPLAARCCCRCWSFDSWGGFAPRRKRLWPAGLAGAGSEARQGQGGSRRRGVIACEETLMAGSKRHGESTWPSALAAIVSYQTSYDKTVIS